MKAAIIVILLILVGVGAVLAWRAQAGAPPQPAGAQPKETLYVAVPMGLFVPFSQVADKFTAQHPNVEIMTMIDTPETMAHAVMENDNKPDLFISPGGHEITVLRENGFIDPDSMVAFGSYEVAILVPKDNPGKIAEPADLLNPDVKVISFSPPDLTAASHAARQALQNLGLWQEVKPKVKVTGCCNESFQWIVDGRAEANVQFLGCPLDPKTAEMSDKQKVAIACTFPRDTYYVPRNVAGIIVTTKKRPLAGQFLSFLTSPEMIAFMAQTKMRNDQQLPLTPGPWGPEQEAGPAKVAGR